MEANLFINLAYILASICFIFGLKLLSSPKTAPKGNIISAIGMLTAIIVTLLDNQIIHYQWILIGGITGSIIGIIAAKKIAMTAMPEMVAIFNGFGGGASLLVGWSEYQANYNYNAQLINLSNSTLFTIFLSIVIGSITFSGSMIAFGKLSGKIQSKPIQIAGQKIINSILFACILLFGCFFCISQIFPFSFHYLFLSTIIICSLILGITAVIPIGGADMPVIISLLNSYSGLAAASAGFVIMNNVLITVGSLVGASGIILTNIMCKSMNRSLRNVLFSGFGSIIHTNKSKKLTKVKPTSAKDAYYILEAANVVAIIPGYGLAVSQAQYAIQELAKFLEANDTEVKYVIHPVAGRMPGHMNVLLAEANVPYEILIEPDDVNPTMETVDVCLIIGANDIVNTSARDDKTSPIFGMPIIETDRAKTTLILKRSLNPGFSGLDNPLFYHTNTRMLFGDAKETILQLVTEFKT